MFECFCRIIEDGLIVTDELAILAVYEDRAVVLSSVREKTVMTDKGITIFRDDRMVTFVYEDHGVEVAMTIAIPDRTDAIAAMRLLLRVYDKSETR